MNKILLATTNRDKIREYRAIFKNTGIKLIIPVNLPDVAETGKTFRENAVIKARAYGRLFHRPVLTDDTGLEVYALNGFPGINSARFAEGDFPRARKEILRRLENQADRRTGFVCVLALFLPLAGRVKTFTGMVNGLIAEKETGGHGFGYDPIFYYPPAKKTFAQMSLTEKNLISHRSRAAAKLITYFSLLQRDRVVK